MSKFIYKAKDWNGKTVNGVLEVNSKTEVLETIKSNGLIPLSIELEKQGLLTEISKKITGRVNLKQVSGFTRQLSTMMTAGLPLTDALAMLKNQAAQSSVMYEILDYCLTTVRGGQSLGTALQKYQSVFGEAYVASINAGEEGGVFEEILAKLADSLEDENEFQGKVKGAMIYPLIVMVGMVIVVIIMMVFVIPKLMSLYSDLDSELPAITRGLMSISSIMAKTWFLLPLLGVGAYWLLKVGKKNKQFRLKKDRLWLKIPVFGPLSKTTILANSTRTLAMLLTAGISLVESLRIVAKVAGNEIYLDAFVKISERVQKGFSISSSFDESGVFPVIVTQMVETGEATGKLDEVLMRVSEYFSAEAEQAVKTMTAAIEPLIMILLGVGVGFLVVAVIMPIYNLTSQF